MGSMSSELWILSTQQGERIEPQAADLILMRWHSGQRMERIRMSEKKTNAEQILPFGSPPDVQGKCHKTVTSDWDLLVKIIRKCDKGRTYVRYIIPSIRQCCWAWLLVVASTKYICWAWLQNIIHDRIESKRRGTWKKELTPVRRIHAETGGESKNTLRHWKDAKDGALLQGRVLL